MDMKGTERGRTNWRERNRRANRTGDAKAAESKRACAQDRHAKTRCEPSSRPPAASTRRTSRGCGWGGAKQAGFPREEFPHKMHHQPHRQANPGGEPGGPARVGLLGLQRSTGALYGVSSELINSQPPATSPHSTAKFVDWPLTAD
jgi:hypothetical protein